MTSKANIVDDIIGGSPKRNAFPPIFISAYFATEGAETVAATDIYTGEAIVMDHDGVVVLGWINSEVDDGVSSKVTAKFGSTAFMSVASGGAADQSNLVALDYDARSYSAGDALMITGEADTSSGELVLLCRPT